jgi:hypothetical protein
MANTEIDKRLVKAIVAEVADKKRYVVSFTAVLNRLKGMAETDGEAYELGVELYRLLNEGAIKYAYLIGSKQSRVVVSPVELTSEQLFVLREVGKLYTSWCMDCSNVDAVIDGLVSVYTRRENLVPTPALAVYLLAKNYGLKIEPTLFSREHTYGYGSKYLKPVGAFKIEGNIEIMHWASNDLEPIEVWDFSR